MATTTKVPDYISKYASHYLNALHTGSRAICPTAVTEASDDDYLLLVHPAVEEELCSKLYQDGYVLGGSDTPLSEFKSFKKTTTAGETFNIIVVNDDDTYARWVQATSLSKALNLTKKEDRVTVFEVFLYDRWPDNI